MTVLTSSASSASLPFTSDLNDDGNSGLGDDCDGGSGVGDGVLVGLSHVHCHCLVAACVGGLEVNGETISGAERERERAVEGDNEILRCITVIGCMHVV